MPRGLRLEPLRTFFSTCPPVATQWPHRVPGVGRVQEECMRLPPGPRNARPILDVEQRGDWFVQSTAQLPPDRGLLAWPLHTLHLGKTTTNHCHANEALGGLGGSAGSSLHFMLAIPPMEAHLFKWKVARRPSRSSHTAQDRSMPHTLGGHPAAPPTPPKSSAQQESRRKVICGKRRSHAV
jgi:hypothetical protein